LPEFFIERRHFAAQWLIFTLAEGVTAPPGIEHVGRNLRIEERRSGGDAEPLHPPDEPLQVVADQAGARLWNADGSPADFCGNAARCVARWLWERGAQEPVLFRMGRVQSEAWRERIAGAVLHREQPLAWRGGFRQIDLLAQWPDRLLVVDYKSSRLREEKHREQVAEYVEAMRAISGKPVEGMILYLLESGVEMVDI